MLRQLGADHHVAFKCLGTNLEFYHKLRPDLLFSDIWAKLGETAAPAAPRAPCCPTACAIGARRVVAVFIRLNKDLRGEPLRRSSRTKKNSEAQERSQVVVFIWFFLKNSFLLCRRHLRNLSKVTDLAALGQKLRHHFADGEQEKISGWPEWFMVESCSCLQTSCHIHLANCAHAGGTSCKTVLSTHFTRDGEAIRRQMLQTFSFPLLQLPNLST